MYGPFKITVLCLIVAISLMVIVGVTQKDKLIPRPDHILTEEEVIAKCSEYNDVIDASKCLVKQVRSVYKYTETDDDLELTFEELQLRGGDCRNYAFLFEDLGKRLGFGATTLRYDGIKDVHIAHRWAELWDDENYCKIDASEKLEVHCWKIEKT